MQGGDANPDADFTRAIATQPGLATPYDYRGEILKFKYGHAADAVAAFQKAEE